MPVQIIKIENLKIENIKLSEPRENKRGGKAIYMNYDYEDGEGHKKLRFQLPKMKAPFGISGFVPGEKNSTPNEISNDALQLSASESNLDAIKKIEEMEEMVIKHAFDNSKAIFGKKKSLDILKELYTTTVKHSVDEDNNVTDKYPPRIRCKMIKNNDEYITQIFSSSKEKLHMNIHNHEDILPKMSECTAIIECSSIWIVNDRFGITLRPAQMKVYKNDTNLNSYAFIDDGDDSEPDSSTEDLEETTEEPAEETEEDGAVDELDPLDEEVVKPRRRKN